MYFLHHVFADEYVRRAITVVRQHGELDKETTRVEITASQYGKDGEYKVGHKVQVGDNYGSTGQYAQVCSDNAIRGANLAVMRLVTDMQSPPKSYTPLLTAPTPVTEQDNTFMQEDVDGDAAEFHPIEFKEQNKYRPSMTAQRGLIEGTKQTVKLPGDLVIDGDKVRVI